MGAIHYKTTTGWRRFLIAALVCLIVSIDRFGGLSAQPMLGLPKQGPDAYHAQITLSNCNGAGVEYVVQMSTDLTNWISVATNWPSPTNTAIVPLPNSFCFYRLKSISYPPAGIVCKSTFNILGNNCTFDSFDSSNPAYSVGGQYNVTLRKANAAIAAMAGLTNSLAVGNADVFGYVYTQPAGGVNLGLHASVGDLNWVSNGMSGIEAGHWMSNYNVTIPDVIAPNTTGWATSLPAPVGASNVLNGNYVVSSIPNALYITGPTVLWVNSSSTVALGVTIAPTNNASLKLYVGQAAGSGTGLAWSGQGNCNVPGYAKNLQIYGLPSLTSIDLHGNASWIGTVYAPEAAFTAGGSGNNTQDTSGSIVVKSLAVNGHWNFHFDESLVSSAN